MATTVSLKPAILVISWALTEKLVLGSSAGDTFPCSATTYGDAGDNILAYWESRRLDFSDKYPQWMEHNKTLSRVKLIYTDDNETDVTISVSADGGVTWTDRTKTLGSGTGKIAEEDFHFWVTGVYLNIKISHSSASDTFQWHEMVVDFLPQERWREVN